MKCDEQIFIDAIALRMQENRKAFSWLMEENLYSLIGSILRLELDSLIRVAYINSRSCILEKQKLIEQFNVGQRWRYEKNLVTDRMMLNVIMDTTGLGWAKPIYDIGCAFIHLSPYHDWGEIEPTHNITQNDRKAIVKYVKDHQHRELDLNFSFHDLVDIASGVFEKMQSNLECEIATYRKNMEK